MERLTLLKKMAVPILVFCAAILGCRKESHPNNPAVAAKPIRYDFSWSGSILAGDTIYFTSTAPAGSTYLWNFGDSTISIVAAPYHIYTQLGTFMVSLAIKGDTAHVVRKKITISGSPYTYLIAGTRTWHHYNIFQSISAPADTTVFPDTVFSVSYIDPATIACGPDKLQLESVADTVLHFSNIDPGYLFMKNLWFDPRSNTVEYHCYYRHGPGHGATEIYRTGF